MAIDEFGRRLLLGRYEGVPLTIVDADSEGGHDLVEHTAYNKDGAELEPAGRKADRGKFEVAVLNGIGDEGDWKERYVEIIRTFSSTPIGQLVHPTHGIFDAGLARWRVRASPEIRSGVYIDVEWIEHNATIEIGDNTFVVSDEDSPSSAVAQSSIADDLGASTNSSGFRVAPNYTEVSSTIQAQLDFIESQQRTRSEILAAFRTMTDAVDSRLALTDLNSASNHEITVALETLRAQVFSLRSRYFPSFALESLFIVPVEMAVWEVSALVYGDASLSNLIMTNNSISDPFFVRAGTTLRILPIN